MKRVLYIGTAAMLLAGCMSLHEVRQTPPVRQAMTAGNYSILANCVAEGLQTARRSGDLLLEPVHSTASRRAHRDSPLQVPGRGSSGARVERRRPARLAVRGDLCRWKRRPDAGELTTDNDVSMPRSTTASA